MGALAADFLKACKRYFESHSLFCLSARNGNGQDAFKFKHDQNGHRNEVRATGKRLAESLPSNGESVRLLLKFLHRIDGGGGAPEAVKLWESLKVEAELLARALPLDLEAPANGTRAPEQKVPWVRAWGKQAVDLCGFLLNAGSGGIPEAELKQKTGRETSKILGDWKRSSNRHKVKLAKEIEAEKRKSQDGNYRLPKKYLTP